MPPGVPSYRTRAQQFDDMVLDAVARLESRWETELEGVEFAVQEVPEADELVDDSVPLPLARTVPGTPNAGNPARPATPARIVVYRRPLMARSETEGELSDLVFDVVVEEFASFLGLDPDSVDPGYRGGLESLGEHFGVVVLGWGERDRGHRARHRQQRGQRGGKAARA